MIKQKKMTDNFHDALVNAINASYKNQKHCLSIEQANNGILYRIKHLVWLLLLVLVSPYNKRKYDEIYMVYSELHVRVLACENKDNVFCFGKWNDSLKDIKHKLGTFSPFRRWRRMRIFLEGLTLHIKRKSDLLTSVSFTIEYYATDAMLKELMPKRMICAGHFDRYATLFSFLAYHNCIEYIAHQHGIIALESVPQKLIVTEFFVYDEFEKMAASIIVQNDDCKYTMKEYVSTVQWAHKDDTKNKIVIAIASQDRHSVQTKNLLSYICKSLDLDKIMIIVYPHYRESLDLYECIKTSYPQVLVSQHKRYDNVDFLITYYSTIVYDYYSIKPDIKVFCLRIPGFSVKYYEREDVRVFSEYTELANALKESADVFFNHFQ